MLIRLQKYLADAGIASRRRAELFIVAGKVKVNDKIIKELGYKVQPGDKVYFENKLVKPEDKKVYIILNKPEGVLSTVRKTREKGRTVLDLVKVPERVFPVGRLDKDSSGLLLLTNDGELALKLTHPRYEKEKEYVVTLDKPLNTKLVQGFEGGVIIDGKRTLKAKIRKITPKSFSVILKEGRKRQIRRICQKFGFSVNKLHRNRINKLKLDRLPSGKWRYLTDQELKKIII